MGLRYICDNKRHLICIPYNIKNLHKMAKELKIARWWFHKGRDGKSHYDIPTKRIDEIMSKCEIFTTREILLTIKRELNK